MLMWCETDSCCKSLVETMRRQLTSGFYMEVHRSPAVLAIMGPFRAVYARVCAQRLHSLFLREFYGSIRSVDLMDLLPVS